MFGRLGLVEILVFVAPILPVLPIFFRTLRGPITGIVLSVVGVAGLVLFTQVPHVLLLGVAALYMIAGLVILVRHFTKKPT